MILTVAACEASIALALIVVLYNRRSSLDVTLWQDIREADVPATPTRTWPRRPSRSSRIARARVVSAPDPRRRRAGASRAALDRAAELRIEHRVTVTAGLTRIEESSGVVFFVNKPG